MKACIFFHSPRPACGYHQVAMLKTSRLPNPKKNKKKKMNKMTELSCLRVLIEKETHSIPIAQYMITIAVQRMHMQNALIGDDINEILKLAHEHLSCAIDSQTRLHADVRVG